MGKKKEAIAIKKPRPGVEAKSTKKTLIQIDLKPRDSYDLLFCPPCDT